MASLQQKAMSDHKCLDRVPACEMIKEGNFYVCQRKQCDVNVLCARGLKKQAAECVGDILRLLELGEGSFVWTGYPGRLSEPVVAVVCTCSKALC